MHKNCFFVFFIGLLTFQVTLQPLPFETVLEQELKEQGYSQEFISNILNRIFSLHEARLERRWERLSSRYVDRNEFGRVARDMDGDNDNDDQDSLSSDVPRMTRQNAVSFEESDRHRRVDHID